MDAGWKISSAVTAAGDVLWGTIAFTDSGAWVKEEDIPKTEREYMQQLVYGSYQSDKAGGQAESGLVGAEQGHELTCLREPTLVAVDEDTVGHPIQVVHYGNGGFSASALRGVDPTSKDWAASSSGATRSCSAISPFRVAGSPSTPTLSPAGVQVTPFSPITTSSTSTKPRSVSPKRTSEINGRNPRGTLGESLYRGVNAVKNAEEQHRLADLAIKDRFELQKQDADRKKTPLERSRSPHAAHMAKRQSITPYSLSPPKAIDASHTKSHEPYGSVDDRGTFREVRPKLPYHHRLSEDKAHHNQHVKHGACADDILDAFRAAGLAKGISTRVSSKPNVPPPRPQAV